jgi:hypothetical protein
MRDLAEPADRVRVRDPGPRLDSEDLAGLGRVRCDEREQLGDGPQAVVDLARVDRLVGEPPRGSPQVPRQPARCTPLQA